MKSIGINKFILTSGERYCIIMDNENKAPLFYPNLYLTIQLRNRECSVLTMEATALTLSLFYRFYERMIYQLMNVFYIIDSYRILKLSACSFS